MTPSERAAFEAGYEAGARAMREAAAHLLETHSAVHRTYGDGRKPSEWICEPEEYPSKPQLCFAAAIRALPLPTPASEAAEPKHGRYIKNHVWYCLCGHPWPCPDAWSNVREPTPADSQPKEKHERRSAKSTYCRCGYPWIVDRCASPDAERAEDLAGHTPPRHERDYSRSDPLGIGVDRYMPRCKCGSEWPCPEAAK